MSNLRKTLTISGSDTRDPASFDWFVEAFYVLDVKEAPVLKHKIYSSIHRYRVLYLIKA
jgi:hypothetical protein